MNKMKNFLEKRKGMIAENPTTTTKEKFAHVRDKSKLEAFLASLIEHDGNVSKAAKEVGYSRTHANNLLGDKSVLRSLEFFMSLSSQDVAGIKNRYLNNLKIMACADLGQMVDSKGLFKGLHKLTPEQSFAIKKVKIREKSDCIETEIELHDKAAINKMLAESDGSLAPMTDAEFDELTDGMSYEELLEQTVRNDVVLVLEILNDLGYTVTFNQNK